MIMIINTQVVKKSSGGGGVLPKEYQQVEYIQSTGTQWINTGYVPVSGDYFSITFKLSNNVASWTNVVGTQGDNRAGRRILQTDSPATTRMLYATTSASFPYFTLTAEHKYKFEVDNTTLKQMLQQEQLLPQHHQAFTHQMVFAIMDYLRQLPQQE